MLFWSVCRSWLGVSAIDRVLLIPVMVVKASAQCFCPFRCFPCSLAFSPVPKQRPLAATSLQACVLKEDPGCTCSIPLAPVRLGMPAVAAVAGTGPSSPRCPVRKQTNSETPLSSLYVLACLLKVCQLLSSWVIPGLVSCFLVFFWLFCFF